MADDRTLQRRRAVELAKNDYRLLRDLIRVRNERGFTQQDVADLLGVSQQAISKFERLDADPRLSTIRQYAHAVGALVAHAVEVDNGQFSEGTQWRMVSFTLPQPTRETSSTQTYAARGPKCTDYAVAA